MRTVFSIAGLLTGIAVTAPLAHADVPPIIDTHVHLNPGGGMRVPGGPMAAAASGFQGAVEAAVTAMDQNGIRHIVLMAPPMAPGVPGAYELEQIKPAAGKYPDRISLMGGGGSLNSMIHSHSPDAVTDDVRSQFRSRAEQLLAAGARGFGEIAAHHLSLRNMGPQHAYEYTPPDHPLLLLLADIAAEHDVPIDLHIDLVPQDMDRPARPIFNPATPAQLKANQEGFERLLAHNRKARIIWAHAGTDPLGTRHPQLQRSLLERHPNLYMSIRLTQGAPAPVVALDPDLTLKAPWLKLLEDFPDRFMLGSDFFNAASGSAGRGPDEQALRNFRKFLEQLSPPLAVSIAHGNAEKLYRLPVSGK